MKLSQVLLRRRLFIALLIGTILFVALFVRLAYVQLWKGPELSQQAEDTWRRNIPYVSLRGDIVDRKGDRLAYNVSAPSVMAVPAQVEHAEQTARQLAQILGQSESKILEQITKRESIVKIHPGGRKITREQALEIRELDLPGIVLAEDNQRYYPFGNLASHVLGFTGIDNQGLTGVELMYDSYLQGKAGSVAYLADASGREIPNTSEKYIPPRNGLHLQLTLDKQVQSIMERELDQAMVRYDAKHAIGIAMNPNTGEVLAMASRPDYEPEHFREYPKESYDRNLPIWMTYEPGSTFKIITLASALEEDKVNLEHDHFFDKGSIEVGGARLRCWKKGGHGSQSFLEGVENSCNPAFVMLGQMLGKETLFDYIKKFGFGQKTGIDLGGEENGILFSLDRVGPVELATTSFGQGVSVTPIQQITAVSAAINGGRLYEPKVAKALLHPETGETLQEIEPEFVRQVISEETSAKVREALESVVANGTGRNAFVDGYRVGGKTGTAQKVVNGRYSQSEHIVSFIGFAPADDPQIVIYVAVDNPKGLQFGGLIAAPIVQNMMRDILPYLGIAKREEQLEKKYQYGDIVLVEVPDLVGLTTREIYETMNMNFTLSTAGHGNTVLSQSPQPGERVERGSTIRLYMAD